jgi:hypothetical protein
MTLNLCKDDTTKDGTLAITVSRRNGAEWTSALLLNLRKHLDEHPGAGFTPAVSTRIPSRIRLLQFRKVKD